MQVQHTQHMQQLKHTLGLRQVAQQQMQQRQQLQFQQAAMLQQQQLQQVAMQQQLAQQQQYAQGRMTLYHQSRADSVRQQQQEPELQQQAGQIVSLVVRTAELLTQIRERDVAREAACQALDEEREDGRAADLAAAEAAEEARAALRIELQQAKHELDLLAPPLKASRRRWVPARVSKAEEPKMAWYEAAELTGATQYGCDGCPGWGRLGRCRCAPGSR